MHVIEKRCGRTAEISFAHPPVNALSVARGLVAALDVAVTRAIADPDVEAIIIAGEGAIFSAGADIHDFDGDPAQIDATRNLMLRIEASPKPVIAAIDGICFGGGLELALAAQYRVATVAAKFALPEITLGLLPGGGGTQRLPRLIGAQRAIDMMLSGKPIDAERAKDFGLIDRVAAGDPVAAAHALVAEVDAAMPSHSGARAKTDDVASCVATARKSAKTLAARRILDCVEAMSASDRTYGLKVEAQYFAELMASEASLGLRHAFFGRRQVARIPGVLKPLPQPPITSVTVIGGGLMGTGIALALVNAGLTVALVEPREDALGKARLSIDASIRRDVSKGRISPEEGEARIGAITTVATVEDAAHAHLFIEAVFEDMEVKRTVFEAIDRIAPPGAILASNTSTLDLNVIADFTTRPEQVVGLHFFSPANIMRLLEVVRGAATSPETLARAMSFAKAVGKVGVVAGVCDGFIGNRIFEEYLRQAWFLLEEGALPQQIDSALEAWGMAMGPCRVLDLAGQDIGWKIRQRRAIEQPHRPYSGVPDRVCELGRYGQKTGSGFYLYPDGRTPEVDPAIETLIVAESQRVGITRRSISDEEIVTRCVYAMINEGAKLVGEGIAYRPVDVDIVYLDGYGFPAERGGPLFYADRTGLPQVLDTIQGFAGGRHGWAWEPASLLTDLVESGKNFGALNTCVNGGAKVGHSAA